MGAVYQVGSKWRADWTEAGGIRHRLRFSSQTEAENHLAKIGAQPKDVLSRFKAKYTVDPVTGCWVWRSRNDYGRFRGDGSMITRGYRFAYETFVGPVPADKELDHLCRNPKCVNPAHLEAVDRLINIRRGLVPVRIQQQRHGSITHCPAGHEYPLENRQPQGKRHKLRACESCKILLDETAKAQLGTTLARLEETDNVSS